MIDLWQVLSGLTVGILVTLFANYLRRKNRHLGYEVLSAAPLTLFDSSKGDNVKVMVRASALHEAGEEQTITALEKDIQGFREVSKVYGFRIRIRNVGQIAIEDQDVYIVLSPKARVVETQFEQSPDEDIQIRGFFTC